MGGDTTIVSKPYEDRRYLMSAVIGGTPGYHLLRVLGRASLRPRADGSAYRGRSKLEALLGPGIWACMADKVVIDFGCGTGEQAVEVARRGARCVIGIDIRQSVLDQARARAERSGVAHRCLFTSRAEGTADVILSIDGFEHYENPGDVLTLMASLLKPGGRVLVAFGPPWLHPLGGHLFSVFPWAHVLFTERALIRWRADFKSDGARRFAEVEGGLNQMTVARFERLVGTSPLRVDSLEAVPIRRFRGFANKWTREFLTSNVRCMLSRKVDAAMRDELLPFFGTTLPWKSDMPMDGTHFLTRLRPSPGEYGLHTSQCRLNGRGAERAATATG